MVSRTRLVSKNASSLPQAKFRSARSVSFQMSRFASGIGIRFQHFCQVRRTDRSHSRCDSQRSRLSEPLAHYCWWVLRSVWLWLSVLLNVHRLSFRAWLAACAWPSRPTRSTPTRCRLFAIPHQRSCLCPRLRSAEGTVDEGETACHFRKPDLDSYLAGLARRASSAAGAKNLTEDKSNCVWRSGRAPTGRPRHKFGPRATRKRPQPQERWGRRTESKVVLWPVRFIFYAGTHAARRGRGSTGITCVSGWHRGIRAAGFRYRSISPVH
jgi:hypothetical protein